MIHSNRLSRLQVSAFPLRFSNFSLLLALSAILLGCDDEFATYTTEADGPGYQHEVSLNQAFVKTSNTKRGITLVGNRPYGENEGNATLRFDIVDDPAEANALFTCMAFMFDEEKAREIDASERATGVKGSTFRLPVVNSGGYLRIESMDNGPALNELMNLKGAGDQAFRKIHLGFWGQSSPESALLRAQGSEVIFEANDRGETVQDALNSAYGLVDMFMANADVLYVHLYEESEVQTSPTTTVEIYD